MTTGIVHIHFKSSRV